MYKLKSAQETKCKVYEFPVQFVPYELMVDETTGKKYRVMMGPNNRPNHKVPVTQVQEPMDAIWNEEDVQRLGQYIKNRHGSRMAVLRDYTYYVFVINTWRRAGDNLSLQICDVVNPDGTIKDYLTIREQKTKKPTRTWINEAAKQVLREYLQCRGDYKMTDPLFPKFNLKTGQETKLSVDAMRRSLQRAANEIGLDIRMGTHTLRKTGACMALKNTTSAKEAEEIISQIFEHSDIGVTRHYIGLEQKEKDTFLEQNAIWIH